jgi:hypothetical protein
LNVVVVVRVLGEGEKLLLCWDFNGFVLCCVFVFEEDIQLRDLFVSDLA